MKRIHTLLASAALVCALASCENDLEPYNDPTCRLNFMYEDPYYGGWLTTEEEIEDRYDDDSYSTTSYSFIYAGGVERDTLWFKVRTSGFLSGEPRPIALRQVEVPDTVGNAVPGVHYVAFDDPSLASFYTVPANADTLSIPVVVLRDPSLDTEDVVLRFAFDANDYFQPGFPMTSTRTVYLSARLSRPMSWYDNMFGAWGPVKHELMIQWTGERWDDAYFAELFAGDSQYIYYMMEWFARKLAEENAIREANGEGPYTEGPEYGNAVVDFTPINN